MVAWVKKEKTAAKSQKVIFFFKSQKPLTEHLNERQPAQNIQQLHVIIEFQWWFM